MIRFSGKHLHSASVAALAVALLTPTTASAQATTDHSSGAAASATNQASGSVAPTVVTDQSAVAPGQSIVVTGTRLRQPNLQSKSPITSVTDQEVKLEGASNIENVLNRLPQVTADANENVSNGADGTSQVNLRNLGSNRNLVLINGQRELPMLGTDVNFIPAFMVKRVDVLTGGASAVYGSDAISGVVNFIMRDDLNGMRVDGQYAFADHYNSNSAIRQVIGAHGYSEAPGHVRDGERYEINIAAGTNFADGRGNVTAYFGYRHVNPIVQADRDVSACALNLAGAYPNDSFVCGGSSNNQYGLFTPLTGPNAGLTFDNTKDGQKTWVPYDSSFLYNYAPTNYFQRSDVRYTAGAFIKYQIVPQAQFYGSFMFMDDHTFSQAAPSALFQGNTYTINCDNPLMSQQQGQLLCGSDYGTSATEDLFIGYRAGDAFPRRDDLHHIDYRVTAGVRGDVLPGIHYDVNLLRSMTLFPENYQNNIDPAKANNAIQVVDVNGTPTCLSVVNGTDANCVPLDIFKAMGMSDAGFAYVRAPTYTDTRSTQTIFNGSINADLGTYGIRSPFATDGVGLVVGAEHRHDFYEFKADELLISQGTNPFPGTSVHVDEFFSEMGIPLVQDKAFAKSLSINLGYRHSKYSNLTKWVDTYKIEGEYAPVRDIRFRASYNRAIRAANILELYSPQSVGNVSGQDPCSGPTPSATLEQCQLTGVTQAQYGHIVACPADVCDALGGGNPALKPEQADTYTVGAVLSPRFLPHLNVSIDYWNIKVKGFIAGIDPQVVIGQCISTSDPFFCGLFHRDPRSGVLFGTQGYIISTNINTGYLKTSGFDIGASDSFGLGHYGSIEASLIGTLLKHQITNPLPGLGTYDCKGLFGPGCGEPSPAWKHSLRATWSPTSHIASISLNWRYIGPTTLSSNTNNPFFTNAADPSNISGHIKAYNYFDLAATLRPWRKLELRAGVNNIFDKDPPALSAGLLSAFGNGNTYPGVYDPLGRYVFAGASIEF